MKIIQTKVKEILTRTKLPGADWVINPYIGCGHNCNYCYARFIARWKKHGKWGSWIETKINAPELLKNRKIKGEVFMSSICDAWQPIEKKLKLTRKILENLDKNTKLSILTKSDLILRDLDLLKKFKNLEVGMTINSFEGKTKKFFEPDSPSNQARIQALKILHKNGISTYAFISPIMPGLIDVKKIFQETKEFVDFYWLELINLRGAGLKFNNFLQKTYPKSLKILKNKTLFKEFIQEIKAAISKNGVKIKNIEIHKNL